MRPILDNNKCPRCERTGNRIADGFWRCGTQRCGGFAWGWNTPAVQAWALKSLMKQPFTVNLSEDDVNTIVLGGVIRCNVQRSDLLMPVTIYVSKRVGEGVHVRNEVLIPELTGGKNVHV